MRACDYRSASVRLLGATGVIVRASGCACVRWVWFCLAVDECLGVGVCARVC